MQETAALTVVDTHIRERLCNICQQEENIETILGKFSLSKHGKNKMEPGQSSR
jgi:hypothetical protein